MVSKMMAKEPGRRFQTPAEVAEALARFFKKAVTVTSPVDARPSVSTESPVSRAGPTVSTPSTERDSRRRRPLEPGRVMHRLGRSRRGPP